jgi:uncharacterized membrane protein YvbJ
MFCVACGAQIDDDAFCRKCGSAASAKATPAVTVTNVYRGKNTQIIGTLVLLVGIFTWMGSCTTADSIDSSRLFGIGAFFFIAGLIMVMVGKYQHWYHAE